MVRWLGILIGTLRSTVRTHRELALENLALRQQLAVWKARQPQPQLTAMDRIFFSEAACQEKSSLVVSAPSLSSSFVRATDACVSCSLCEGCRPSLRAVSGEWRLVLRPNLIPLSLTRPMLLR